jgi:hypothetical protein
MPLLPETIFPLLGTVLDSVILDSVICGSVLRLSCILQIKRLLQSVHNFVCAFHPHPQEGVIKARKLVSPFEKGDEGGFGDALID